MVKKFAYILAAFSFLSSISIDAQSLWTESKLSNFRDAAEEDKIVLPEHYMAYTLSVESLKSKMKNAPTEADKKNGIPGIIITLPMPDGSFERFEMYDSPVMEPGLCAKYPSIKSYKGASLKTPSTNVRFDMGPYGFHAAIHGISKVFYIDPYARGNTEEYLTYDVKDQHNQIEIDVPFCGTEDESEDIKEMETSRPRNPVPVSLRVYRYALACTGEWGALRGTVENVLADMNTATNRVNQIYENELAIRLVLVDNNDLLIHFDPSTDPYLIVTDNSNDPNATSDESGALIVNSNIINSRLGQENYDIGHLFHTSCNVGGIARPSSMCRNNLKGAGLTCHYTNLNYMAAQVTSHEIGHQMSAHHTFNNCDGNEQLSNAYEPGSGSTIMSYGGTCGGNNVVGPFQDDDYYHVASLIQIYNYTRGIGSAGNNCAQLIETSNLEPTVSILHDNDFYIPENTYFFLEGLGEDENEEDELTYCWEQFNIGNPQDGSSPLGSPIGDAPHFRSFPPRTSPIRYFPSPDNIIAGNFDRTEVLFEGDRTVNFMLTVRDNNAEAGTSIWKELQFHVVDTPVKFGITSQSTSETYTAGDEIDVTWNVAGTNLQPVNAQNVDILLFTGTHQDFDLDNTIVLAKNVFNTGTCRIIVPNEITSRGRIIVKASEGNFFSINARNLTIVPATEPSLIVNSEPLAQIRCTPTGGFEYEINSENLVGVEGNITYTVLNGLPHGAEAIFEPEVTDIGTESILTITPADDPVGKDYEIVIGAITESMDTFTRTIYLNIKSSNHSQLEAVLPEINAISVGVTTPFSWTASPNADFYKFELSKSPAFGDTNIESVSGLTELNYEPDVFFDKNTVYYWRVTASNYCGDDPQAKTFAFSTESLFCTDISPAEGVLPINISGSGAPTIQAPIDVNISGNVSDINVKRFFGEHENNKDLVVTLISPEGKEVILVSKKCEQSNFNCGFDDASNVDVKCPLNNGTIYKPIQSLGSFNGDVLAGTWNFQIEDTQPGNGGKLQGIIIQFCSNQVLDNPYIVRNEKIAIPIETTITISSDLLKVEDDNNTNEELIYTIVELPGNGILTFDSESVNVGDQFSQKDIDDDKLSYTSSTENYATYFSFTVIDGEGGFIGVTNFEIEANSTTSVDETKLKDAISIYPIPARNLITVDFSQSNEDYSSYEIVNLHGQTLMQDKLNSGELMNIDISQLSTGLYIVNFRSSDSWVSKKIIVN